MYLRAALVGPLLIYIITTSASSTPILNVSPTQWHALNVSVGGRLHAATPFALPCFSKYNNISVSVNEAECNAIQANYTSPDFRIERFSANMNVRGLFSGVVRIADPTQVQYETCMSTDSGCLLDSANPRNPLATDRISCNQGEILPYYVGAKLFPKSLPDIEAFWVLRSMSEYPVISRRRLSSRSAPECLFLSRTRATIIWDGLVKLIPWVFG